MRLIVLSIVFSFLPSVALADCEVVRKTVDVAVSEVKDSLFVIGELAQSSSSIEDRKNDICYRAGQINGQVLLMSDLVVKSLGKTVSLSCYRGDSSYRSAVLDATYYMFSFANRLYADCKQKRSKQEILNQVDLGLTKIKTLQQTLQNN